LLRGAGAPMAQSFQKKIDVLRAKFFFFSKETNLSNISARPHGEYAAPPSSKITVEKIIKAIKRIGPDKAPKISNIFNKIL